MATDKRFFWLDDTDLYVAQRKISDLRKGQLSSWRWLRWVEDQYESKDETVSSLVSELGVPSMYDEGKVVYTFGIPKCQSDISDAVSKIPGGILFIVIAKPNKTTSLFKVGKKLETAGKAVIDEVGDADKWSGARKIEWIVARAKAHGLNLDDKCAQLLLDMYGFALNRLSSELAKLSSLADEDGGISAWAIAQACHATGDSDVMRLCRAILDKEIDLAHELLSRLLARGDSPEALLGFMKSWIRRLAIVSEGYNETQKGLIAQMRVGKKKNESKKKSEEEEDEPDDDSVQTCTGESVPMFPNPGSLYYSFKEFDASSRDSDWAKQTLLGVGCLNVALRQAGTANVKRQAELMHQFIDNAIAERSNG
jgi:DNA polymerase III delta subunit